METVSPERARPHMFVIFRTRTLGWAVHTRSKAFVSLKLMIIIAILLAREHNVYKSEAEGFHLGQKAVYVRINFELIIWDM